MDAKHDTLGVSRDDSLLLDGKMMSKQRDSKQIDWGSRNGARPIPISTQPLAHRSALELKKLRDRASESAAKAEEEEDRLFKMERKARNDAAARIDRAQRRFQFSLSAIRIRFLARYALGNLFLEFEIGGQRLDVASDEIVQMKTIKEHTHADGKVEKFEATHAEPKMRVRVVRRPAHRYYTRLIAISVTGDSDEPVTFRRHSTRGEWAGTYEDLASDTLTVRVWHRQLVGANVLIAEGSEKLRTIASGKVDRELLALKRREDPSAREEGIAIVSFRCELEELFSFQLEFQDWELSVDPPDHPRVLCWENMLWGACRPHSRPSMAVDLEIQNTQYFCWVIPYAVFTACECGGVVRCPCTTQSSHLWLYYNADKWGSRTGDDTRSVATLQYYGTRSALEDDRVTLRVHKDHYCGWCCADFDLVYFCRGPRIGVQDQGLQGKLDYGYMVFPSTPLHNASSAWPTLACAPFIAMWRAFEWCSDAEGYKLEYEMTASIKGVIRTKDEPRYRQLGNVGRPSGSRRWFRIGKTTLLLAVKVIRAKGLVSLAEYKETLSPSVTLDWAQTRRETRVMQDDHEPFWDEWMYFRIPRGAGIASQKTPEELKDFGPHGAGSKIVLNVWDNSSFTKRPLGHCEIDFEDIYEHRKPMLVENQTGGGTRVSRYVFSATLSLDEPTLARDGAARTASKGTRREGLHVRDRTVEILAYFEMGSARIGPPRQDRDAMHKKKRKKNTDFVGKFSLNGGAVVIAERKIIPQKRDPSVSDQRFRQARTFWVEALRHVPDAKNRCFSFCGIDEYSGNIYFLPTFISRLMPPSEISTSSDILYFVHSIEHSTRRSGKRYKAAIAAKERLGGLDNLRVWSDPWNFLDKRRGDHRDHAVLLCNFLLGHNLNAYVCLGRVRVGESGKSTDHAWVLTLEEPESRGSPRIPGIPTFYRTVRFWEASNGRTYIRMNPPRSKSDRDDIRRAAKRAPVDATSEEALLRDNLRLATNEAGIPGIPGDSRNQGLPSPTAAGQDFAVGETCRDSRVRAERERRRFRHQIQSHLTVFTDDRYARALRKWQLLSVTDARGKESAVTSSEQHDVGEDETVDSKQTGSPGDPRGSPILLHPSQDETPYLSIDVVFNHEQLYANLQARHPEKIIFDFANPRRWLSFAEGQQYFRRAGAKKVSQFYPDKTMISRKAPSEDVAQREDELLNVLRGAIQAHREFQSLSTDFLKKFPFQETLTGQKHTATHWILTRLEAECRLGERCPSLLRRERARGAALGSAGSRPDDVSFDERKYQILSQFPESVKGNLDAIRELWTQDVVGPLSKSQRYSEALFHFKHADTSRVSDRVIEGAKTLLGIPDSASPRYGVGVKIDRLPGMVSPARILICCIYSDVSSASARQENDDNTLETDHGELSLGTL